MLRLGHNVVVVCRLVDQKERGQLICGSMNRARFMHKAGVCLLCVIILVQNIICHACIKCDLSNQVQKSFTVMMNNLF